MTTDQVSTWLCGSRWAAAARDRVPRRYASRTGETERSWKVPARALYGNMARKMPARAPSKDLSRPWIRVTVLVHASVVRRPIRSAIFGQVHSILVTNMSKSYQITGHYFSGSHWRKNTHILVFRRYGHTATVIICRCSNNIFQQAQVLGKQCPWVSPPEYRLYRRRYISFEWSSQILHSPRNGRIWLFVWWGTFLLVFLTELKNM